MEYSRRSFVNLFLGLLARYEIAIAANNLFLSKFLHSHGCLKALLALNRYARLINIPRDKFDV